MMAGPVVKPMKDGTGAPFNGQLYDDGSGNLVPLHHVLDGANETQGAKADPAATDATSAWSVTALLKGMWAKLEAVRALLAGGATSAKQDALLAALGTPLQAGVVTVSGPLTNAQLVAAALATAGKQDVGNASLAAIAAALQNLRAETLWTDDSGASYVRVDTGSAVSFTTPTGAAATPGAGLRPAAGLSSVLDRSAYQATAAGTGFSIGDALSHFVTVDASTSTVVGHFWLNQTSEAVIAAPPAASITPISPLPAGAATAANQAAQGATLAAILSGVNAPTPAGTNAIGTVSLTGSLPDTATGNFAAIGGKADTAGATGSVSLIAIGKQLHADLLAPTPDTAAGDLAAIHANTQSASNIATGQGSATPTSAQLIAARAGRRSVTIRNLGSSTIYLGASAVTTTTGQVLLAGETLTLPFAGALYGVTVSATVAVSYHEVF